MNYFRSTHKSLKYLSFTPSGCKVKGIRKFEFVGKTQLFVPKKLIFCHKLRFLKWVSLQPNIVNLKYFKPWIMFIIHVQIIEVCNIKGLHHQVARIKELENLSLWQFLWFFRHFYFASSISSRPIFLADVFPVKIDFVRINCLWKKSDCTILFLTGKYRKRL